METHVGETEPPRDGSVQEWEDAPHRDPHRSGAYAGRPLQSEVYAAVFACVVTARDVRVRLGTTRYQLVNGRRATIRDWARAMGLH